MVQDDTDTVVVGVEEGEVEGAADPLDVEEAVIKAVAVAEGVEL